MSFFRSPKNVEVTRGKIGDVWRMLKCFLAKSLKLIPHQIGSMGTGVIMQKMTPSDSIPGRYDFMARRSTLSHQETNHEHTLHYAHHQGNKETTCAISLCMSPMLQMAVSIRSNTVSRICQEYVLWHVFGFHLIAPYIIINKKYCSNVIILPNTTRPNIFLVVI